MAIPEAVFEDIAKGSLHAIDVAVYGVSRNFCIRRVDSCWCARETAAGDLGITGRTVSAAWKRLSDAGHGSRRRVPKPDPDDPKNRTAWRFDFAVPKGSPGFVPIPRPMFGHIANGKLEPIDLCTYAAMSRLRSRRRGWCDASRRAVAHKIGRGCAITVTRSWRRLEALGYLARDGGPAPDDTDRAGAVRWRLPYIDRDESERPPSGVGGPADRGPAPARQITCTTAPRGGADFPVAPISPKLGVDPTVVSPAAI